MDTEVLVVDPAQPDPRALARAVARIRAGELVAFPTETVYGLGARADDAAAVAAIFAAKGRPAWNPLIVHVLDIAGAQALVRAWPEVAGRLAAAFWPGPLTLVLPRVKGAVAEAVTGGGETVALRAPSHPVARSLIAAGGLPLAAPSANRFQQLSPVTAAHVVKSLGGRVPLVLDGGRCTEGLESTVVDLAGEQPAVLRFGALPLAALRAVVPTMKDRVGVREDSGTVSPGTASRHYAPQARLLVVAPEVFDEAIATLRAEASARVGAVRRGGAARGDPLARVLPADPRGYGAALYETLHGLDEAGATTIVCEAPPASPGWEAVRDRLRRAVAG